MRQKLKDPKAVFTAAASTGRLIKAFRRNFEITQEVMANLCGLKQAHLSAIENDQRPIGADVALRISGVMGVDPSLVLYPSGYESEPEYKHAQTAAKSAFKKAR